MNRIKYRMNLTETEHNTITSDNGTKYHLEEFLTAISRFNDKCPKTGGIIMRSELGHMERLSHITHSIQYVNGKLIADIEPLEEGLDGASIRPIIMIPLRFGSGIRVERVLEIMNIYLES
jgi:hypothetical protein